MLVRFTAKADEPFSRSYVPATFTATTLIDFIATLEQRERRIEYIKFLRSVGVGTINSVLKIMCERPIEPPEDLDIYWMLATSDTDFIAKMNTVLPLHLKLELPKPPPTLSEAQGIGIAPAPPAPEEIEFNEAQRIFRLFTRAVSRHAAGRLQGLPEGDIGIDRLAERFVDLMMGALNGGTTTTP